MRHNFAMKTLFTKVLLLTAIGFGVCAGCKSTALNDAAQTEKKKEESGIDKRADAADKVLGSSSGN
jgi:hypothetical protein